jgi:radical SAM superfamily enzyme YgiQ (UPF0313 family)
MEPLSIATLASQIPDHIERAFYDDRIEEIPYDEPTDLVAISVETYTARRSYQIAQAFRKRGAKIVIGGYHPSLVPGEAEEFADAVVLGEAENVWPELLKDAEKGQLKKVYKSESRPALDKIRPDRSILKGKKYLPIGLVEAGRGCKFSCDFCSITSFYNHSYNYRPTKDVVAEMEACNQKMYFLVDDNVVADFNRAKELFKAIAPLKTTWFSQGTLNVAKDTELLGLMQKSGCGAMLIGFESLSPVVLRAMNKSFNIQMGSIKDLIARIHDHGIRIYATFVFGYDHDSPDLFQRTLDFAMEQKFFLAAFNHLQPFPGTPLYQRMKDDGRMLYDKWWLEPGVNFGSIIFQPKIMSPMQLYEKLMDMRRSYYSYMGILKRSTQLKANIKDPKGALTYFSINQLLRKEIGQKWGLPLGDPNMPDPV